MIDFDAIPKRRWTDERAYRILSQKIYTSQDRDFEKIVLDLVRMIWTGAVIAPSLGWIDQSGIDILVWEDEPPFPLAVQCKGFKVHEEKIGDKQISQCLQSISKFQKSNIKVDFYALIHNRTGQNRSLRETVEAKLRELVISKQVKRAELWDKNTFLKRVLNYALYVSREAVTKQKNKLYQYYDTQICESIEAVPYSLCQFTFGPNQLLKKTSEIKHIENPTQEILDAKVSNLTLLIGEAGYGKTTALLRSFSDSYNLAPLYIPAASIPRRVNNTRDLLRHCIQIEDVIDFQPNWNSEIFRLVFEAAIHNIITSEAESSPLIILLDGLDESVYISRRGGIQAIFNQLRHISVPVVLTARKEFWLTRQEAFSESFGSIATVNQPTNRRVKMIELLAWESAQIKDMATRYHDTLDDNAKKSNVLEFIKLVEEGSYAEFFGDIPRRPLFLRLILETISKQGIKKTGRAKLYYDWAKIKVQRDIRNPMKWGEIGRQPIISEHESEDETLNLSFFAMMLAAKHMTQKSEGDIIELLPECTLDNSILLNKKFQNLEDPVGLFLNSLLLPVPPEFLGGSLRIRFSHRTYQEFFLAYFIKFNPEEFSKNYKFPTTVTAFISDIEKEDLN